MSSHLQPWVERPALKVDLDLPPAQRYASFPPEALRSGRELLSGILAQIPPAALSLAHAVRLKTQGRFQDEAGALAKIHGATWEEVVLANISYDLLLAAMACSTVALPTPDGPVVARNMDWFPEDLLARASYLLRYEREGETAFVHAGFSASIGVVTGLSAAGFALVLNAVASPEGTNRTGYPVLLFLRKVLEEAAGFDAALGMLLREPLAMSGLITLVGGSNQQRVVIERSPSRHALRWGRERELLLATNHFRVLHAPDQPGSAAEACPRYEQLCKLLSDWDADDVPDDELLLTALNDPGVIQSITAQHVLIRPRQKQMRLLVPRRFFKPQMNTNEHG
ncbi:MAG: C45 family peptidase [Planctomycetota bacterium]